MKLFRNIFGRKCWFLKILKETSAFTFQECRPLPNNILTFVKMLEQRARPISILKLWFSIYMKVTSAFKQQEKKRNLSDLNFSRKKRHGCPLGVCLYPINVNVNDRAQILLSTSRDPREGLWMVKISKICVKKFFIFVKFWKCAKKY